MYPINTIARSAQKDRKLNILLFNDSYTEYVINLGYQLNDVNFYLFENRFQTSRWVKEVPRPSNVKIIKVNESAIDIDAIIVFNRGRSYEEAISVSNYLQAPVILIDFASSEYMAPIPFFANSNIENKEEIFARKGIVNIGINEHVSNSWRVGSDLRYFQTMSLTIKPLSKNISISLNKKTKVLIPKSVPDDFVKGLPNHIVGGLEITKDIQEAGVYLNLWQNLDEDTIACMKNEIPVVSFESYDIPKDCYFLVNPDNANTTLRQFLSGQFSEEQSSIINNTKKIAKEYVSTSEEEFKNGWNNVFNLIKNTTYIRR